MIATARPPELIWRTLTPWTRRIRLARVVVWWSRGLIGGLGAAIVVLVASRLTPWASATTVAIASVAASSVALALGGWIAPLSPRRTAMIVDGAARLADRVTTAWELRDVDESFARIQRSDALTHLVEADPRAVTIGLSSRQWTGIVALALAAAIVWLAPNPMTDVLRRQAEERARIQNAAVQVQRQADELNRPGEAANPDQATIEQALRDLARRLERAGDTSSALAAVSQTEQQLRSLSPPGGDRDAAALRTEASALESASATVPLGDALANRDPAALARATRSLQDALAKLSPDERAAIARTLQAAANAGQATSSGSNTTNTSAALRAASQALQQGDLSEASAQLDAARAALDRQVAASERADSVAQAAAGLDQARSTISGIASYSGSQSGTAPGDGAVQPEATSTTFGAAPDGSTGTGTGAVAGQSGANGNGGNQANSAASGNGQSNGTQAGGTGGRGPGGGQRPAEAGQGVPGDRVFIPGQASAGTSEQEPGPAGPSIGADVPYQQVIGQYAQSAQDHLDRRSLPPEVRDLVRNYFVGLQEGSKR